MELPHVQPRGNRKVYRRKVRKELKGILGKGEIILPLGKTDAEVRKKYDDVHARAEAILAAAWDEARGVKKPVAAMSARELFDYTIKSMRDLGFNPYMPEGDGGPDDLSWIERDVVATREGHHTVDDLAFATVLGVERRLLYGVLELVVGQVDGDGDDRARALSAARPRGGPGSAAWPLIYALQ